MIKTSQSMTLHLFLYINEFSDIPSPIRRGLGRGYIYNNHKTTLILLRNKFFLLARAGTFFERCSYMAQLKTTDNDNVQIWHVHLNFLAAPKYLRFSPEVLPLAQNT